MEEEKRGKKRGLVDVRLLQRRQLAVLLTRPLSAPGLGWCRRRRSRQTPLGTRAAAGFLRPPKVCSSAPPTAACHSGREWECGVRCGGHWVCACLFGYACARVGGQGRGEGEGGGGR